jgi:hypothetical protein
VRLGPSTPGDYVRARVLVPLNPGCDSYTPQPNPVSEQHNEDNNMVAPRRSNRQRTEKSFSDDFIVYLVDDTPKTLQRHMHHQMQSAGRRQSTMKWSPF